MRLRRHLPTVAIAIVASAVTASAPAIAHGVQHALFAHDSDKVDGKHAVGSGATVNARRGKLVATNVTTGRLPNNIIATAPNANRLDGMDSTELGMNGYASVRVQSIFDSTAHKVVTATCPEGTRVVGGGASVFPSLADPSGDSAPIVIRYSTPTDDRRWTVIADEISAYGHQWWVAAAAICAK